MTLKQAVAQQLMQSNVGLKLVELTDRIDKRMFNSPNNISTALTELKLKGYAEKSPGYNNSPSRWRITAQGRAFYSTLNQDNENEAVDPDAEQQVSGGNLEIDQNISSPHWVDIEAHDFAVLKFNTADTLDRALYGLVKLIRDVAKQEPQPLGIENKQDALELLETMESNTLISGTARATFARIRHAVEQMEDAA